MPGIAIDAVETYAFQGGIFDGLSPEYQEVYLASGLLMILDPDSMSQQTKDALTAVLGRRPLSPPPRRPCRRRWPRSAP